MIVKLVDDGEKHFVMCVVESLNSRNPQTSLLFHLPLPFPTSAQLTIVFEH